MNLLFVGPLQSEAGNGSKNLLKSRKSLILTRTSETGRRAHGVIKDRFHLLRGQHDQIGSVKATWSLIAGCQVRFLMGRVMEILVDRTTAISLNRWENEVLASQSLSSEIYKSVSMSSKSLSRILDNDPSSAIFVSTRPLPPKSCQNQRFSWF